MLRLVLGMAVVVVAALGWGPSTVAAQPTDCVGTADPISPGDSVYCVKDEVGLLGQFDMTSLNEGTISIRHLERLVCEARGYNDFGDEVASITIRAGEDWKHDCFRRVNPDNVCYEFSPIVTVNLLCWRE